MTCFFCHACGTFVDNENNTCPKCYPNGMCMSLISGPSLIVNGVPFVPERIWKERAEKAETDAKEAYAKGRREGLEEAKKYLIDWVAKSSVVLLSDEIGAAIDGIGALANKEVESGNLQDPSQCPLAEYIRPQFGSTSSTGWRCNGNGSRCVPGQACKEKIKPAGEG